MDLLDRLLAIKPNNLLAVDCPEYGMTFYVKKWSAVERTQFYSWVNSAKTETVEQAVDFVLQHDVDLVILSVVDVEGNKVFPPERREELSTLQAEVLARLATKALLHNMVGKEDEQKKSSESSPT